MQRHIVYFETVPVYSRVTVCHLEFVKMFNMERWSETILVMRSQQCAVDCVCSMLLRNPNERELDTQVVRILHTRVGSINFVSIRSISACFIFKSTFRFSTVLVVVSYL
jgi:hypothetical protein